MLDASKMLSRAPATKQPGDALAWGRRYLMCPPDHFEVAYSINPWMDTRVVVDRGRAQEQWHALVDALGAAGAEVETIAAQPGLPDMVFTANAGLATGGMFVPARMRHPERRDEPAHFQEWFALHGWRAQPLGDGAYQEGIGDALPFGDFLVAGYQTRSTSAACEQLATIVGSTSVNVELIDPRYYHVDLTFCPLDDRHALVSPCAWTESGLAAVMQVVPEALVLEPEEVAAFCANSVVVGRTVIMPACTQRIRKQLELWGFDVVVVDVSEFMKAGGAVRCLTLPLDLPPLRNDDYDGPAYPLALKDTNGDADAEAIALADEFGAHNYHPLDVVVADAQGIWVWDHAGNKYLDALAAYSALNFGHRHPRLVAAAQAQLGRVTLTSRAFHNDQLGPFCQELAQICGMERVLPMNTGAEAVETAIKAARKWGYQVKGVAADEAKIVVCAGNFHGRTTTIVSFSDDPVARNNFGPFTPGFVSVPFGDADALADALADPTMVAFLFEPVQGEAGVIMPPDGYLGRVRELCTQNNVLMLADEIQSGLGRTGYTFACDYEQVKPDVYILGKALGGGIVPISAVVSSDEVLGLFKPGEHGSTFGGNPLACAVAREVVAMLAMGEYQERARRLGTSFLEQLRAADLPGVSGVRGRGLWYGVELAADGPTARRVCELMLAEGVLAKETHEKTVRLAPPLTVTEEDLQYLLGGLGRALIAAASSVQ